MPDAASQPMAMAGRCMCGAVTFTAVPSSMESGACHCEMCRKWSGGAFMAVSATDVAFADDAPIAVYGSSDWGERVFCQTCGTTLVWRMKDGSHHSVAAPAFDDQDAFPLKSEIFIDSKPSTFAFAGDHERLTQSEVMAKYAPEGSAP